MSDSSFSKGFLLGALIGAGIVFFLGTKKGQELKEELLERGEEFLDQAEKMLDREQPEAVKNDQPPPEPSFAHLQMIREQGRSFGKRFFHRRPQRA